MDLVVLLIIVLAIVLVWRGPKTLPKLGQALGRGVREAKAEASKAQAEIQARTTDQDEPSTDDAPPSDRGA